MKIEKVEKLVANLRDKKIVLKKFQRVIKFNQNVWLKPYFDMNTDLRKKANNNFEKAWHYRKKEKLLGVRTKISYYKVFHRISISNRPVNKPVYLGFQYKN